MAQNTYLNNTKSKNMKLPIDKKIQEIRQKFTECSLLIVSTPTGSGKTLKVPATILDGVKGKVYVTVPRVLLAKEAVRSMNKFIFNEEFVGLMTGNHTVRSESRLVVATEGSFINRVDLTIDDVLVVDEVHEQGVLTEQLLYIAREHCRNGGKAILMSATIDLQKYIDYYDGINVGVVSMPKKDTKYPIKNLYVDDTLPEVVFLGKNTLIGAGGKAEIENTIAKILKLGWKGKIFPLHAEIEEWEEEEALNCQEVKIIVATSVAMSGITFKDLEVVVPPTQGKMTVGGVLVNYNLSMAEIEQWRGRVGRVTEGICIYKSDFNDTPRDSNSMPQILRSDLRDVILNFAMRGYDLSECDLLNQPDSGEVKRTQKQLIKLSVLGKKKKELTEKGLEIMRYCEGLFIGMFVYEGVRLGIEATARKLAVLCSQGSPYRKIHVTHYPFMERLRNSCSISKHSEHYLYMRCIEEDIDAHFTQWSFANEVVKDYGAKNNIFLKGVNKLKRQFDRIDAQCKDAITVDLCVLRSLFEQQEAHCIFENLLNNKIGFLNTRMSYSRVYATLSPIETAKGRLADMATALSDEQALEDEFDLPF